MPGRRLLTCRRCVRGCPRRSRAPRARRRPRRSCTGHSRPSAPRTTRRPRGRGRPRATTSPPSAPRRARRPRRRGAPATPSSEGDLETRGSRVLSGLKLTMLSTWLAYPRASGGLRRENGSLKIRASGMKGTSQQSKKPKKKRSALAEAPERHPAREKTPSSPPLTPSEAPPALWASATGRVG